MDTQNLVSSAPHFNFGANWLSFVEEVDEKRIVEAIWGLERLLPAGALQGRRFLDIGCGSGLHMLAALRLGACHVAGVDIDEYSLEAARRLLSRFAPNGNWSLACTSVFDLDPSRIGHFDIVYSWSVLHHTGNLWLALRMASDMVAAGGLLAIAVYRKTLLCGFWAWEKRVYLGRSGLAQLLVRWLYQTAYLLRRLIVGKSPFAYVRNYYKEQRGMSWTHDIHRWLGGFPYESAMADEVAARVSELGFEMIRQNGPRELTFGLFRSGSCNEYVARRAGSRISCATARARSCG